MQQSWWETFWGFNTDKQNTDRQLKISYRFKLVRQLETCYLL